MGGEGHKAMNIYNYVWFTNVRSVWGWKRGEGAIHPPQKLGNKSQSENKLEGFTKYGAFEVHIKLVYNDNLQLSDYKDLSILFLHYIL